MRHFLSHLCVTVATTAAVLAGPPPAASIAHPGAGAGLDWRACPKSLDAHPAQRCAELRVPLDYRRPHGKQITITISRIPAADPARRLGALILSPGGPGLGGLGQPSDLAGPDQPPQLRQRYDLIGFDARGIRHSTPITCGLPPQDRATRYPAPDGSIGHSVIWARQAARACQQHAGDLLRHITTANTARDLDRIRAALAESRISFYGLSYGTYLGATYATLYPHRTDRFVLDSAIDPRRIWYGVVRSSALGLARRLPDLTGWLAARNSTYHLGGTPDEVLRRYRALAASLDRRPVEYPGLSIDGNWLRDFTRDNLEQPGDTAFPLTADVWQELAQATSDPTAATTRRSSPVVPDLRPDNRQAAQYAVQCGDAAWPHRIEHYERAVRADRLRFPDDAGRSANITPCAFWPTPVESPVEISGHGPRNVLLLHNRRDPATPWISALAMRTAFGPRATLITATTGGHGVIGADRCATALALNYLTDDTRHLPADQACPATETS